MHFRIGIGSIVQIPEYPFKINYYSYLNPVIARIVISRIVVRTLLACVPGVFAPVAQEGCRGSGLKENHNKKRACSKARPNM